MSNNCFYNWKKGSTARVLKISKKFIIILGPQRQVNNYEFLCSKTENTVYTGIIAYIVNNIFFNDPLRRRERASFPKKTIFSESQFWGAQITKSFLSKIYSSIKLNSILYLSSSTVSNFVNNYKDIKDNFNKEEILIEYDHEIIV